MNYEHLWECTLKKSRDSYESLPFSRAPNEFSQILYSGLWLKCPHRTTSTLHMSGQYVTFPCATFSETFAFPCKKSLPVSDFNYAKSFEGLYGKGKTSI